MINRLKGKRAVVTGATAGIVDELPIDKSRGFWL
jgi:short-subunit dehydrogenase